MTILGASPAHRTSLKLTHRRRWLPATRFQSRLALLSSAPHLLVSVYSEGAPELVKRAARKWGCQTARCGLRHSLPRGIPRTQHLMAHTHRSPVARRDSFFMLGGMSLAAVRADRISDHWVARGGRARAGDRLDIGRNGNIPGGPFPNFPAAFPKIGRKPRQLREWTTRALPEREENFLTSDGHHSQP